MAKRLNKPTLKTDIFQEIQKDEVKAKVDIVSLFSSFGVKLEKKGQSFMGLCPFHDDSNPSLSVSKEKGVFNCFGCGESGDVFDVVMKLKELSFGETLKFLNGGSFKPVNGTKKPTVAKKPVAKLVETVPVEQGITLDEVAEFYHKELYQSKEALSYLESRGLLNKELYKRFKIGFSSGGLTEKLSDQQREALKKQGVYSEKGYELMSGCITVPLLDGQGKVKGMYGRAISDTASFNHRYLAGGHAGVFNAPAAKVYRDELVVTESIIDALSLIQLGLENVVPCYGTNGLTDLHLKLFNDYRVETVVLAFDADEAGQNATQRVTKTLVSQGISVKSIVPPKGKDWNEFLLAGGTADQVKALCSEVTAQEPEPPEEALQVTKKGLEYVFSFGNCTYKLLGVKESFVSTLKVNIAMEKDGKRFPDNCDLYSARSRSSFSSLLSSRMEIPEAKIEDDLLRILRYLEKKRDKELEVVTGKLKELTEEEQLIGLDFLTAPDLFDQIIADTETLGYVGDDINKLLVYLCASSRKLDDPISVLVVSESASGKSYLAETILKLMPTEESSSMTSLSNQALNYMEEDGLVHKFLVMGEAVHGEEVEHQVREMLSAKVLSRLVTTKDAKTGSLTSKMVKRKAVVAVVMSTTNYAVNPENASRFFVVNTNESEDQTQAIHKQQRYKYSVTRMKQKEEEIPSLIHKHQCAQRLLKKHRIVNPFAPFLDFPSKLMRSRRDHERFIDLISVVCFLRQYQKEEKEYESFTYLECDLEDYEVAYQIMTHILPATLSTFPKAALELYEDVRTYVKNKAVAEQIALTDVSFTQREIREKTGHSYNSVRRQFQLLCNYEYLKSGGLGVRGSRNFYQLVGEGPLHMIDLSMIPTMQAMKAKLQNLQSESSESK
jgi:DNA primase catalytic core